MKTSSLVIQPRFVALDSSHLGAIARDRASPEHASKQKAEKFQQAFDASGSVLLLSWHHIQELLSHHSTATVIERISYLRSLPLVACVTSASAEDILGGVLDLLAFEVRAVFNSSNRDPIAVRDDVSRLMLRVTTGAALIQPFSDSLPLLQPEFARQQERAREIVAISRSNFADVSHEKVIDLLRQKLRPPNDIARRFDSMHTELSNDIRTRGDKRISDADETSAAFLDSIKRFGTAILTADNPGLQILRANGLDLSDVDENMTIRDVGDLATFRNRLRIVNRLTQLPWTELKTKVSEKRLPSQIVQSCVNKFRPESAEWKGSDLNDAYLSCLAPYADVTYVDKRTYEAFRTAKSKMPEFAKLIRYVEKAGHYADVAEQVRSLAR